MVPELHGPILPTHTGCWHERPGQGIDLYVNPDITILYWYTHLGGARRWYYGVMPTDEPRFKIMTTSGGTFYNPVAHTLYSCGIGQISSKDNRLIMSYETDEHGRDSMVLSPVVLSRLPGSGAYYNKQYNGSGLSVQVLPNDKMSVFWYTYDGVGNQRWLTCQGSPENLKMYEAIGTFRYGTADLVPVGGASFNLQTKLWTFRLDQMSGSIPMEVLFEIR